MSFNKIKQSIENNLASYSAEDKDALWESILLLSEEIRGLVETDTVENFFGKDFASDDLPLPYDVFNSVIKDAGYDDIMKYDSVQAAGMISTLTCELRLFCILGR